MSVRALLIGFTLVPAFACGSDTPVKNKVDGSITLKDSNSGGSDSGSGSATCNAATTYPGTTSNQMAFPTGQR